MASYLWGSGTLPALGVMVATLTLGDNSVNDLVTGEVVTDSLTFGAGCGFRTAQGIITAVCDLGSLHDLTAWSFAGTVSNDTGDMAQCNLPPGTDPPDGATSGATVYTSTDGTAWTARATPAVGTGNNLESGSFAPGVQGRYVAVVLSSGIQTYDQNDTITASARVSDLRVTGTPVGGGGPCTEPDTPANLAVGEVCSAAGDRLPVSWSASTVGDAPITYELRIAGHAETVYSGPATATTVTGLTFGQEYCFEVRAVNACGTSAWSAPVCGTPNRPPSAPTLTLARSCCGRLINVTLAGAAGGLAYRLVRVVGGAEYFVYAGAGGALTLDHPDPLATVTYRATVTGHACGTSAAAEASLAPLYAVAADPACAHTVAADPVTAYTETCP